MARLHPLWDLPVRIIHWSIALIIPASWWTAEEGYYEQHQWLGLSLLVLLLTRLVWGFVGSPQARFSDFLRGPGTVFAYLRGVPVATPGHNPLGALSVLLLWLLLLALVLTGTVNTDDLLFTGPFREVFDSATSDALAALHEPLFLILCGFTGLHLVSVAYHEWRRGDQLLRPMLSGATPTRQGTGPARPLSLAVLIAAFWSLLLWVLLELAPEPVASYW